MQKVPLVEVGPTKVVVFPHITSPHACSTRLGGVSPTHLASLNAGFTVGDDPANVWHNRSVFSRHLGVKNLPWLLSMDHGNRVVAVEKAAPLPADLTVRPSTSYQADGCITNMPGVPLSLTVADCVPVFFEDPVKKAVGVTHAGWRGTVAGIVTETVKALQENYGSSPEDIRVGIGPSIGPDAFEVGPEVVAEFLEAFPENPEIVRSHPQEEARSAGKAYIDLWTANRLMARRGGVPDGNIVISGWCTVSHPDLFFSHRRDKGRSGRLLAGIILQ